MVGYLSAISANGVYNVGLAATQSSILKRLEDEKVI